MDRDRIVAGYALVVGVGILGLWAVLIWTGRVPELRTAPFSIFTHLVAEGTTAVALLAAGAGRLRRQPWSYPLGLVAFGMLLYAVVNSAGHYAQLGEAVPTALFSALAAATLVVVWWSVSAASDRLDWRVW